jgi:hypothetical protein
MISALDTLVRDLIQSRLPALAGPTQVGFEPPNEDWRLAVVGAGEERLNLYLYETRENVKLRSNARIREPQNGGYVERAVSPRLDCRYLVTAWSPASFSPPMVEPTRHEHELLGRLAAVLFRHQPLVVSEVYAPGPVPGTIPGALQEQPLPLEVALPDGLRGPGDFWTTMKVGWKPALDLTVTIPVVLDEPDWESPAVTTLSLDARQRHAPATARAWLSIGGRVLAGVDAAPVGGAWVELSGLTPPAVQGVVRRLVTRSDGRFLFSRLATGRYRIRAVAPSLGELTPPRDVDVPSGSGEYDVRFP